MYRESSTDSYHDSEDDDLPFDMDSWNEDDDSFECSRPGNPLPKILNDESERNPSKCSNYLSETDNNPLSLLSQKRVRGESLDGHYLHQLTSSGERWQFQKCYLPPHLLRYDSNMFSQSYLVPVHVPNDSIEVRGDEAIVENLQELELLDDRSSSALNELNGDESGDHRSKKSRINSQSNLLKSVENIEIISQKRKKCHEVDEEFSHFTNWDL
jgi:hypothetical protein